VVSQLRRSVPPQDHGGPPPTQPWESIWTMAGRCLLSLGNASGMSIYIPACLYPRGSPILENPCTGIGGSRFPTASEMKSAPAKKSTLLRLRCQPASPMGTKSTTHAATTPACAVAETTGQLANLAAACASPVSARSSGEGATRCRARVASVGRVGACKLSSLSDLNSRLSLPFM